MFNVNGTQFPNLFFRMSLLELILLDGNFENIIISAERLHNLVYSRQTFRARHEI